ncbi:MAG: hypothetical protein WCF84_13665, partial [Anaerolineae bacterium]
GSVTPVAFGASADLLNYIDSSTGGTNYYYIVCAFNAVGNQSCSPAQNAPTVTPVTFSSFDAGKPGWLNTLAGRLALSGQSSKENLLSWTAEDQAKIAGFDVYRSEQAGGPYVRLNAELIPAETGSLVETRYGYADQTALAGRTYYYAIDEVALDGTRARHGPVALTAPVNLSLPDLRTMLLAAGLAVGMLASIVIARRRIARR